MTSFSRFLGAAYALAMCVTLVVAETAPETVGDMVLPTLNATIFQGGGKAFYQHVVRNFNGVVSYPWQGGQYGFVRNPYPVSGELVYTRFHEGIDIKPISLSEQGEPQDDVFAIADGEVVHANYVSAHSSYGKYVVVSHLLDGCRYYSLYAHLNEIFAESGKPVNRGQAIGKLGYTGNGITRDRSHLHFEINLMLNRYFEKWYDCQTDRAEPNRHGIYNGENLAGIDVAKFYLAKRKKTSITVPEFLSGEEVFYKITIPNSGKFELPELYPWMLPKPAPDKNTPCSSWEISFTQSGLPIKCEPSSAEIKNPAISWVKPAFAPYEYLTKGYLGTEKKGKKQPVRILTERGKKYIGLISVTE